MSNPFTTFVQRFISTEPKQDLQKEIIPEQGQVDLSVFEKEAENQQVKDLQSILGGVNTFGITTNAADNLSIKDLILVYRQMAMSSSVHDAVSEITNEAIIKTEEEIVQISLEKTQLSDSTKDAIKKEFEQLLKIMDFTLMSDEYFRQWYVDGRLYSQNLYNNKDREDGIIGFNILSPFNLKRIKTKDGKQYYLYTVENQNDGSHSYAGADYSKKYGGFLIPEDHINFTPSGLKDPTNSFYISHLHNAIIPFNQLKLLEDALVVYSITKAIERRHFKLNTGKMPPTKADAALRKLMDGFKNRVVYDRSTGTVVTQKNVMTIAEDYWSSYSDDGKGLTIEPIQGGAQIADMTDMLDVYRRNMLGSLKVPFGRFDVAGSQISFGDNAKEINRDELRFAKFINSCREKFGRGLFIPMLKKQLIMKNIMDLNDFSKIENDITFEWAKDQYFEEIAAQERLKSKLELLGQISTYVGEKGYFSQKTVYKDVLGMTEEEIKEERKEIDLEKKLGTVSVDDMGIETPPDGAIEMPTEEPVTDETVPETPPEETVAPEETPEPEMDEFGGTKVEQK